MQPPRFDPALEPASEGWRVSCCRWGLRSVGSWRIGRRGLWFAGRCRAVGAQWNALRVTVSGPVKVRRRIDRPSW